MWEKGRVGGGVLHTRRFCVFEKIRIISSRYERIYLRTQQTRRKRVGKKKNKNPGINPGQPAGKGRKKKKP